MSNFEPYSKRAVTFVKQVNVNGWRIKVYSLSVKETALCEEIISNGVSSVLSALPQPALSEARYGVGFLIIHQGLMRNWFLLDWWEQEDILHHKLFSSNLNTPASISAEEDKSLIACVHELRVIAFESNAWIKTVLSQDKKADFDEYMKLRFNLDEKI